MQRLMAGMHLISGLRSEEELISGCRNGDRAAQKELFELFSPRMYAVCLRYAGNADDAKDLLQEGFITVFTRLDSYSGNGSFEGWMRKIFVNTALMHLRRNDALKLSEDITEARTLSDPEPAPLERIGYHQLMKLIASLPPDARTVFNLHVVEGYSHKEIADMLGITEVTSRSRLQRARVQLQELIKKIKDYDR